MTWNSVQQNYVDGKTVINAEFLNTLQDKVSEVVSVKDFGAVGDGVADDTAAIQAALNAAVSSTRRVFIPKGKYCISQISIPTGLEVFGDGIGGYGSQTTTYPYDSTVLFQKSGVNDDAIVFNCPLQGGFYRLFNVHLHDFIVLKKGTADTVGNGISARQVGLDRAVTSNHCLVNGVAVFERILVRGFPENGMYFKQGAVPMYCNELSFIFNGGYGIRIDGVNYIRNIILRNIAGDGNKGRAVIYVSSTNADAQLTIDGVYSEYRSDNPYGNSIGYNGAQPYAVELGTFAANSNVYVANVLQESIVSNEASTACLFITATTQAGTPRVFWQNLVMADLTAASGQKATLVDNRPWDSYVQYIVPAEVCSGVYSLVDTGNSACVRFKNGFTAFGDGFIKPPVGSEGIQSYGKLPVMSLYESDAGANAKGWSFGPSGGVLYLRTFDDTGASGNIGLTIARSGTTFSYFEFGAGVRTTGNFRSTGIPTYADNASAISGGLAVGDFYKTSTGELRVRY